MLASDTWVVFSTTTSMPLGQACRTGTFKPLGLTSNARLASLTSKTIAIAYCVQASRPLETIILTRSDGKTLQATAQQYLLQANGKVRPLSAQRIGSEICCIDGIFQVTGLQPAIAKEPMWGLRPVSECPRQNILIIGPFLCGSIRYNLDWQRVTPEPFDKT